MSVNESEARLIELSRKTFLSMWSYQNPFYDEGKELCDVLIVFGDDVIIMSDKVIGYSEDSEEEIAWRRWYKKAVLASVSQLHGALKTIKNSPERIHLDAKMSSPFPLRFPDPTSARFHLIAVAHGSEAECTRRYGAPSLGLDSGLTGNRLPCTVGVSFPEFVHVINRTVLDTLFECFDTISDFVLYLSAKEALLKNDQFNLAGEEDLVALYMQCRRPGGDVPLELLRSALMALNHESSRQSWSDFCREKNFLNRKKVLAPSYLIDEIMEQVASEYCAGRILGGQEKTLEYHASAFHLLASEPRMARMLIGVNLSDVLHEDPSTFWTVAVESPNISGVIYLWLIYPVVSDQVSDDELEVVIQRELSKYVFVTMGKFPTFHTVFGIAMPNAKSSRTSRAFRMAVKNNWTPEMQAQAELLSRKEGILGSIESTVNILNQAI